MPGRSGETIELDHLERYRFACKFAENRSALDIACGIGYSAPLLVQAGAVSYDGVDINAELVRHANQTFASDRVHYFLGDICEFGNGRTYDMITCFETIEHVEDYESALKNLYKLLNPGGMLLISTPNRPVTSPASSSIHDKPGNPFHTQEFTSEELLSVLQDSGFKVSRDNVYGQRQRHALVSLIIRSVCSIRPLLMVVDKIIRTVYGNLDVVTSPVVTRVGREVPRYLIIIATK